jgi:hypothetical protein
MLWTMMDANTVCQRVGYLSASQSAENTAASSGVRQRGISLDCIRILDSGLTPLALSIDDARGSVTE